MDTLKRLKDTFDLEETVIGRSRYFNSAVLALLCCIDKKLHLVFQKRSLSIRQGGEISFPGGGHEDSDATFLDTALRETEEEIGIPKERIDVIGKIGTLIVPTGVIVEAYMGYVEIDGIHDFHPNRDEVEELIFIPLDFFTNTPPQIEKVGIKSTPNYIEDGIEKLFPAKELGLPEVYQKPWGIKSREVYFYFYKGETIWGITADIIREMVEKVKEHKNILGELL